MEVISGAFSGDAEDDTNSTNSITTSHQHDSQSTVKFGRTISRDRSMVEIMAIIRVHV